MVERIFALFAASCFVAEITDLFDDMRTILDYTERALQKDDSESPVLGYFGKTSKKTERELYIPSKQTNEKISELREQGFCILREQFAPALVEDCRQAFWPRLLNYVKGGHASNRGPHRHFVPLPFDPPIFVPQFFFDDDVLCIVRALMGDRIVADQWGCDVPVRGSEYQGTHVDYRNPLFPEAPDLILPVYFLVVSFGLVRIAQEHGSIEIAPGTHRMIRAEALRAVETGEIEMQAVPLEIGDVLIRHPWAVHRGTPNTTDVPRALATIRYVRHWYADGSRDVESIPIATWQSLTAKQQEMMRFPLSSR